jgi:DNA-binding transcriptional MerR regulator
MSSRSRRPPTDDFLTVTDVARGAGVEAHVVRFYARAGLIRPTRHAANGYRQFVAIDVKRVRFIRAAQSLGFTLVEIREVMRRSHQRKTPCPLVRDIIVQRLAENRERLEYVSALQDRMQQASERWNRMPDQVPRGDAICALIEAVADGTAVPPRAAVRSRLRAGK